MKYEIGNMKYDKSQKRYHDRISCFISHISFSRGFTLIELMVVISIISMLSTVVLATIRPIRAQARDAARKQEVHQLDMAIQSYITDKGHPPEWVGCELQVNILDPNTVSGCVAISTQGLQGYPDDPQTPWGKFAKEIRPYMPNVPSDPCGSNCIADDGTPLGYTYMPPAVVWFYSDGSNSNYQLSAALETGSGNNPSLSMSIAPLGIYTINQTVPTLTWSSTNTGSCYLLEKSEDMNPVFGSGQIPTSGTRVGNTISIPGSYYFIIVCYTGANRTGLIVHRYIGLTVSSQGGDQVWVEQELI